MRDLNLIPKSYLQKKKTKSKKKTLVLAISTGIAVIVSITIGIFGFKFSLNSQRVDFENKIRKASGLQDVERQIEIVQTQLQMRQREAVLLDKKGIGVYKFITEMESVLPASISLDNFGVNGSEEKGIAMTINAKSQDQADILQFISNLRKNPNFLKADITSLLKLDKKYTGIKFTRNTDNFMESVNDPGYSFSIEIRYGGDPR